MMKSKKGIEMSVSFLVKLIMAIVIFSFGIWFARSLFSTGGDITDKAFSDWDKQVAGLSCSPGQKVCIPRTTIETETENGIVFGLVIKNVFDEKRNFRYWVEGEGGGPTRFVDPNGNAVADLQDDTFNFIPSPGDKRLIKDLGSGKDTSVGVVIQHIGGTRGTAAFNVNVEYKKPNLDEWESYGTFKVYHRTI